MKFNELLNRAAAVIPAYRQIVFKTIIIAFDADTPQRSNQQLKREMPRRTHPRR